MLQKMIKQRQELVELYQKGNRADLVKQEQEEIAIISGYLPKQMSEAEMTAAIEAAIKDTGAAGMKDMGKVIGALRGKYAGQMDMAKASATGEGEAAVRIVMAGLVAAIHVLLLLPRTRKDVRCRHKVGHDGKRGGHMKSFLPPRLSWHRWRCPPSPTTIPTGRSASSPPRAPAASATSSCAC